MVYVKDGVDFCRCIDCVYGGCMLRIELTSVGVYSWCMLRIELTSVGVYSQCMLRIELTSVGV